MVKVHIPQNLHLVHITQNLHLVHIPRNWLASFFYYMETSHTFEESSTSEFDESEIDFRWKWISEELVVHIVVISIIGRIT